jgi:hypothetical protein
MPKLQNAAYRRHESALTIANNNNDNTGKGRASIDHSVYFVPTYLYQESFGCMVCRIRAFGGGAEQIYVTGSLCYR